MAERFADNWKLASERLIIRFALPQESDIEFLFQLWTDGRVMKYVGFPQGLCTDRDKIRKQLEDYGPGEFDRVLLIALVDDGIIIGECKLGLPGDDGIAYTDVKLSPEFWGYGYGREIKRALVSYLFEHTDSIGIQGTPHRDNAASIKMQESVGAKKIKEDIFRFPDSMRDFTCEVPHYLYILYREDWEAASG